MSLGSYVIVWSDFCTSHCNILDVDPGHPGRDPKAGLVLPVVPVEVGVAARLKDAGDALGVGQKA